MRNPAEKAGCSNGIERLTRTSSLAQFPPLSQPRPGILIYRAPRTPGEVLHAIANALRREARVSDERRVPVPNDVLRDIADWGVRGCVPST